MRLIICRMLGFLLMLSSEVMPAQTCPKEKTNGCSVPGGAPFIYKKTFTPACDKHDVCYSCGEKWGWSKTQCDKAFKKDMYELCENKIGKRWFATSLVAKLLKDKVKRGCQSAANLYYGAVFVAGHGYWSKPPLGWCQKCNKKLGDPKKPLGSING